MECSQNTLLWWIMAVWYLYYTQHNTQPDTATHLWS
jgi:hypothetical protein